ncbi:hypothetical protein GOBAR_DD21767 [Gossypium barbadense]|nr:hypothetical protein GOBAR_DD21767 [Gossypium barbadense]
MGSIGEVDQSVLSMESGEEGRIGIFENDLVLDGGAKGVNPMIVETVDHQVVEVDGSKFSGEEELAVYAKPLTGAALGIETSVMKETEVVPVDDNASMDNGLNHADGSKFSGGEELAVDAENKADIASGVMLGKDNSGTELNDLKDEEVIDILEQAFSEKVDGGGGDGIQAKDSSAQPTEIMAAHETENLDSDSQSKSHPKLSSDQGGENGDSDIDVDDLSDSEQEEDEDEYDKLPPFKALRKAQLAKLDKEQRKAYFEEYDYRVKLLQKKQWREELRRMRELKKRKPAVDEYGNTGEDVDQETGGPAAVPVPLPDMVLPPSFDADNPAYRYRFFEPTSQFLARPVLDTHGWDHDCGYDGVNVEHSLAIANQFPATVSVQLTKDKKEFNIHLDSSVSTKHGENGSTMAGFDIQNVGKQLAYIFRGETKFKNLKKNKTAAGFSVTFLGENVATGLKLEDHIVVGKRLVLVGSTGTVRSKGDSAYGANLEMRLRGADFPIDQDQSTLGLSLVKWRGDLALGANFQTQLSVGRSSKVAVRAGLNNKMSGQITVRTSSSDQLQIALTGLLPVVMAIYKSIKPRAIFVREVLL